MLKIQSHLLAKVRETLAKRRKIVESVWSGTSADAFFDGETFDHCRKLQKPEYEYSGRTSSQSYYVIAVDVGRHGCDSVATVVKVIPQALGGSIKSVVNIYTYEDMHFEDQAIKIKRLFYKYKAQRLVVDANGVGLGFVDYLVKSQVDPKTGDTLPDFGVYDATFAGWEDEYKKYRTDITETNALYLIKANAPINTEAHSIVQTWLNANKVQFLIDERIAKQKLLNTTKGKNMTPEERKEYLMPYTLTGVLREEMLNLREENEGLNIILKQANKSIKKDKFSSLEYAFYYIKQYEDLGHKKKKKFKASDWAKLYN